MFSLAGHGSIKRSWKIYPAENSTPTSSQNFIVMRNHVMPMRRKPQKVFIFPRTGKSQIVTGRTKMLDSFPNIATFSSAWMIYVSIRSSYDLERGPTLSYWTERLVHYYQGFEWSACLNYAIAYFMKHQNASPETWYSTG